MDEPTITEKDMKESTGIRAKFKDGRKEYYIFNKLDDNDWILSFANSKEIPKVHITDEEIRSMLIKTMNEFDIKKREYQIDIVIDLSNTVIKNSLIGKEGKRCLSNTVYDVST